MWREKQTKKDGQWIDISDDISSFRKTVMEVNQAKKPVKGIEPGRGGFAIRGVVPIKSDQGKPLGSAEVLIDFNPIVEDISVEEGQSCAETPRTAKHGITGGGPCCRLFSRSHPPLKERIP